MRFFPMFSFPLFHRSKRLYARRLPPNLVRRSLLSVRVNEHARRAVLSLAHARGMSASEYIARLLNDHLIAARPLYTPHPNGASQ